MYICTSCDTNFTGLGAFDKHQSVKQDDRRTVICHNPENRGLEEKPVRQYNGKTYRTYGMLSSETNPFATQGAIVETTLIRQCEETGETFVAWGKGRPPTKLGQGRAKPVKTAISNVGKWIDREGNVYDERPVAEAKPAKAKPKAKGKPASAKAVKAVRPAEQPAQRIAMPVPPPPPAAVVDGKTLVAALADGDLHPDTFEDPPFAEDSYESLYGESGALERPEPDDYMHEQLVSGSLRGYSLA